MEEAWRNSPWITWVRRDSIMGLYIEDFNGTAHARMTYILACRIMSHSSQQRNIITRAL